MGKSRVLDKISEALNLRASMVGWYEPRQLARTAYQVFLSTIFGRHADRRLLQAGPVAPGSAVELYFNFSEVDGPFWFDYIADVGDGFDSTYTMASCLAQPMLKLMELNKSTLHTTERGKILVFGGDEVYPAASAEVYRERLIKPYNAAFPGVINAAGAGLDSRPAVFAIPGNHDWYDSLVAFSDLFMRNEPFCGWRTMQKRSYFALRLPRGWWLFGTDTQLGSSLDRPQIDYFASVMKDVPAADRIILCNAEPNWINAELFKNDPGFSDQQMTDFNENVLRDQVAVFIAGDRHYYRRHEETGKVGPTAFKRQKITAGGGGAFLHPTHNENVDRIGKNPVYKLKKSFPDPSDSRRLSYWNLLFPLWNPSFGLVTAVLYLLTARAFLSNIGTFAWSEIHLAIATLVHDTLTEPFSLYWVLLFFIGFLFFTDTASKIYRWIAGTLHAIAHLAATFVISWQVSYWLSDGRGLNFGSTIQLLSASALIFIGGWIVGSAIMGIYLFVSLHIFGRHHNDAFSALKIADYKNFLRLKIEENGELVIFPVGIKSVIKKWKFSKGDGEQKITPKVIKDENLPILIEQPIRFAKPVSASNDPVQRSHDSGPNDHIADHVVSVDVS
ncbi:MAG: hypothetical protein WKF92_09915 [Pyrinomonadaceae bacterium]